MILLSEVIDSKEIKTTLEENTDAFGTKKKNIFIQGPFIVAETRNANNRIYSRDSIIREVNDFTANKIQKNRAGGELNHPDTPTVNLERISHYITELKAHDNVWYGKAKLANTPKGKIAQVLLKDGYQFGVSTRGLGEVSDDGEVCEDYKLITVDLVSDPSAREAYMEGVMENKQYIIKNGVIFEAPMKKLVKRVSRLPVRKSRRNEYIGEAISEFMDSLIERV